jgi:putative Mn2+ efflux pump MntP
MNAAMIFQVTSLFAGIGWIVILFISPFWGEFDKFLIGFIIALLALVYTWLNFSNFHPDILKNFSSLEGVMTLFRNPELVDAAWVHILAFDLVVAVWIKKNALSLGIPHAWIIPSLIFSCLFGPLGYLIYLFTRWIKTKNYFSRNF